MMYEDAKKFCRAKGAFLINLTQTRLIRNILTNSTLTDLLMSNFVNTGMIHC